MYKFPGAELDRETYRLVGEDRQKVNKYLVKIQESTVMLKMRVPSWRIRRRPI